MNPRLIHCSYHKCLTVFFRKVMSGLYNRILPFSRGYRHFNSKLDDFYRESDRFHIASVNNHMIDLDSFGDARVSRFIRDPRDLVVSGYFYHRRGAEQWCHVPDPKISDWLVVNGNIPTMLAKGESFFGYLNRVEIEDGLIAELEFRRRHFESMLKWPIDDDRVRIFRYEEAIGNERNTIAAILDFYGVSWVERRLGKMLAHKFSARKRGDSAHIRNPEPGQWRQHFSPKVHDYFDENFPGLLERYGYVGQE